MWTCRLRRKKTSTLLLALNEQPSSKQQATTSSVLRLGIHFNTDIEHETAFDVEKRSVENDWKGKNPVISPLKQQAKNIDCVRNISSTS